MTTERKKKFIIDVLYIITIILIAYFVLKYLIIWLMPFLIGFIVAIVLQSPVKYLSEKVKIPRGICSFICVFIILTAVFAALFGLFYGIYSYIPELVAGLTSKVPIMKHTFSNVSAFINNLFASLSDEVTVVLSDIPSKVIDVVVPAVTSFLSGFATKFVVNTPFLIISSIITIVASFFLTNDYPKITAFVLKQLPEKEQNIIVKAKSLFVENVIKMLRGYTFIMLITFVELFIGLSIIRKENALLVAACIAVFDILPVLGSGGILITWAVIDLILGKPIEALGIIIIYGIVTVIRNIIEPKIIGHEVGLTPIITLVSMFLGFYLFGPIGLFALPVLVIIAVRLQEAGMIHIFNKD